MRLFYVTLNNPDEARTVARTLLEARDAVCCNWFPITCSYLWDGEIKEGNEIVLIVKTLAEKRVAVAATVAAVIDYTNFIGEIELDGVNEGFARWLHGAVA